jgi:hypothetical protein
MACSTGDGKRWRITYGPNPQTADRLLDWRRLTREPRNHGHPPDRAAPTARRSRWVATLTLFVTVGTATGARGGDQSPGMAAQGAAVSLAPAPPGALGGGVRLTW